MENDAVRKNRNARQSLMVWLLFFAVTLTINIVIPLAFGIDLRAWTYSSVKGLLLSGVVYAGFFIVVPLTLTKGWSLVKKPSFLVPMLAAMISVIVWYQVPYMATVAIAVFVYLHWRFDLSGLGFKSKGWRGNVVALALVGLLALIQVSFSLGALQLAFFPALSAALFRMFSNPASTVENLFYYGFLTERLGNLRSHYIVPIAVGAMYTAHEITNPEYWYAGTSFVLIFVGVTVFSVIYLWRRNIGVTWLSDGLRWFLANLF